MVNRKLPGKYKRKFKLFLGPEGAKALNLLFEEEFKKVKNDN